MKKIIYLFTLMILISPFSNALAADTDIYVLDQSIQQIPPDVLITLDLSASMFYTPAGPYLYIDPGACTHWTNNCGDNIAYYPTSASPHTISCSGSGAKYAQSSSYCSTGPLYKNSGSGHNYSCSGVPSTLYYDAGNCTSWTNNCGDNVGYYPTSGGSHTTSCSAPVAAMYGASNCAGPYYKTSGTGHTTNCSRAAIAQRAIKMILDAYPDGSPNGVFDNNDFIQLGFRMGYMRFNDCASSSSDTGDNYNAGCNLLKVGITTNYSTVVTEVDKIAATDAPAGYTQLVNQLKEAKLYLDRNKDGYDSNGDGDYTDANEIPPDNAKACRKKFVILITDGQDTTYCSAANPPEWDQYAYKRRRATVAQVKALANAGYKVFVVGFGADLPIFQRNTLNWAAYYGGTNNSSETDIVSGTYNIPIGQIYPTGLTDCFTETSQNRVCYKYSDYIKIPQVLTTCTAGSDGCYCYATSNDPGQQPISGYAYMAGQAVELENALNDIKKYIFDLLAKNTSYVAPVVPISQMESTSSGDRMYLAMFRPNLTSMWHGNIKKFGIAGTASANIKIGDIVDSNNQLALWDKEFLSSAISYWSSAPDGGEVELGGIGKLLLNRDFSGYPGVYPRQIWTYTGGANKTLAGNLLTFENPQLTCPNLIGIPDADLTCTNKKKNVIDFAYGFDPYNWGHTADGKREWILGAFIHSRPLVIHYSDTRSVIYAGANDGMFHAFDDAEEGTNKGKELWAFIPPSLLRHLQDFGTNNTLQIFADGTPKAYIEKNTSGAITKATILFGLRRGGDRYIALDVTNPDSPTFLYEIASPSSPDPLLGHEIKTGFNNLGQTWSIPVIKRVANGTGEKVVAFFAGGYDTCNDPTIPNPNGTCGASDQKGNAIYTIDVTDGSLLWSFSKAQNSAMTFSIPSDITAIDLDGDDKIDRLYVGDLGGQLWRFDIDNLNNTAGWTSSGKVIFKSNDPPSAIKRKIFYPPDVAPGSNYTWVYFGTGDREKPKQETGAATYQNRLYAIKDSNPASPLTESNNFMVDVTDDILQNPNPTNDPIIEAAKVNTLNDLKNKNGWFITLEDKGEKCLAPPVAYSGVIYYTTYTPYEKPTGGDPCILGEEGTARLYALQYASGMAAFNLDLNNDTEGQPPTVYKTDRSMEIGKGIPSKPVFTIIKDNVTGYIGVGDGVAIPAATDRRDLRPLFWRIVF